MEIHTIFIPLLICTGIFGFTDGQLDSSRDLRSIVFTFFEAAGVPSEYVNATPDKYKNETIYIVRKSCNRSGEAGALTMVTKIQETKDCILAVKESIDVEYARITKDREGTTKDFINTFCPRLANLESCLNNFKKDNPCLGPAELEGFDAFRDISMASKKFICKNDGKIYEKVTSNSSMACFEGKLEEYSKCVEARYKDMPMNPGSEVSSPSKPQKLPWSLPSKEDCARVEKVQECNLDAMQQCTDTTVTNAIKDRNNEILVAYRCRNSANSQSSPGSLIILLIVTAFTALRS